MNDESQSPLSPDAEALARFEAYLPLLERVASQLLMNGSGSVRDMIYLGAAVLLRAAAEWNEGYGLTFKEFAEVTLTGELLHHMHYPVPVLRLPAELGPYQPRLNAMAQSLASLHAGPTVALASYQAMAMRHPTMMPQPSMALATGAEFYGPTQAQYAAEAPGAGSVVKMVWKLIKKRLPLIVALVVATEGGIAYYTINSPKTWVAYTTMNSGIGVKDPLGGGGDWFSQGTIVANITELLKSRTVLENTIATLGLKTNAEDLADRITVSRMGQAGLLKVEAEAEGPGQSAELVNTLVREFMQYYATSQSQDARSNKSFFESQVKAAERRLRQAESKLKGFKGAYVPEMQADVPARVGDLIAQRDEAARNLAAASAALAVVSRELGAIRRDPLLSQRILNNGNVLTATEKVRELQMNLMDARDIYGADSPVVKNLQNQIARAKSQLRTTTVEAVDQNPALADASARLVGLRADVAMNSARLASLNASIAQMKPMARQSSVNQVTYEQLQREVKIAETQYVDLQAKHGQSNLVAQGAANLNVSVVDSAVPPKDPLSSKLLLKLILGFLLSFGLGVFISYLMSLREHDDELAETGAPASTRGASVLGRGVA